MSKKVTKVRIEYDDGSAREVRGEEHCADWTKLVDAQAGLWMSRGWAGPMVHWILIDPEGKETAET